MNKKILSSTLVLCMGISNVAYAAEGSPNLCDKSDLVYAYFNGVLTTEVEAKRVLSLMQSKYGTTTALGDEVAYELMYNETQGMLDFIETFHQRFSEETLGDRWELFTQVISNRQSSWWGRITQAIPILNKSASLVLDFVQRFVIGALNTALSTAEKSTYIKHELLIEKHALEGKKFVMLAHSQGNLYVNKAYKYATQKTDPNSVGVIHVAPASPTLSGNHILVDQDLVINGLRLSGSVPPNTDSIPVFNPIGNNFNRDAVGHGIESTYLNPNFVMESKIRAEVERLFQTLKTPENKAQEGFFNVTMNWDGLGDVDLHVTEPSGKKVFYSNPTGESGYLDVDNTQGYGPEHYYATCEASNLQTGTYQVQLANYYAADGRTVKVQVSSNRAGVLDTQQFVLGSSTGDNPSVNAFNLLVTKNEADGRYNVSVAQ